ncbi:hypothetical protein [Luteolibacter luteus]|uniref:Uncharacterized protein n=1 Tax=Luteolibacter luteus TaxID=2728835 RepID=A0A858RSF2_9BACT|nr:hypothetical protein [Luteolibacter luteus]QJE99120.1 hypothetical protein HHL09_26185 [Luteolibacter luteus]
MKPKPLHRSITFWSGILVMIFIAWVWVDSSRFASDAYRHPYRIGTVRGIVYLHRESAVRITPPATMARHRLGPGAIEFHVFPPPLFARGKQRTIPDTPPEADIVEQVKREIATSPPDAWVVVIPHWLLLLAAITVWLAGLVWRDRRQVRAGRSAPEERSERECSGAL